MRKLACLLTLWIVAGSMSWADTIQVTVGGDLALFQEPDQTYPPVDPWDSSVPATGDPIPYSLTFTYDSNATYNAASNYFPLISTTLQFGDYTVAGTGGEARFVSGSFVRIAPQLFSVASGIEADTILDLYPKNASSVGTSLSLLQNLSISQLSFPPANPPTTFTVMAYYPDPGPGQNTYADSLESNVLSYRVQDLSTPEPSTWTLLGIGFICLAGGACRGRFRRGSFR